MSTDTNNPKGQQLLPATQTTETDTAGPKGRAATPPKAGEGVKPGDRVQMRQLVGGPVIRTVSAEVLKVHKGDQRGPLLDLATLSTAGARIETIGVPPEPAGGADTNQGGHIFPCWARIQG